MRGRAKVPAVTTAIASEVRERRRQAPPTLRGDFLAALGREHDAYRRPEWPSLRYQRDPVAFAREAVGVEPWSRQIEILEAVRDHDRVAVSSGHKVAKSHTAVLIALWFFCSFPDARVVMSSTTSRQVDQILWRELRMMTARSRLVLNGDPPYELARSGYKSPFPDFREIVGFTAREAEAVAGISGKSLLYIIDEASGVDDAIFEAIEGNRAGGARIVLFSNPTKSDGEFYEAFHGKKAFYKTLQISSEETPNARTGREVIPGLATRAWVEEKRREWGVDSPLYAIRVQGKFVTNETGKIISALKIAASQERHADVEAEGHLQIGVDPAGEQGKGDESGFAARRGNKQLWLDAKRGLTAEGHADVVRDLLTALVRQGGERTTPVVAVDVDGVGMEIARALADLEDRLDRARAPERFQLVRVKASVPLRRNGRFDRLRDALWGRLERWIREGGAIMSDAKLAKELHVPTWDYVKDTKILKATSKDAMRAVLGRSPDRADALALAVWEPSWLRIEDGGEPDATASSVTESAIDPYLEEVELAPDRVFDPYGGVR